VTLLELPTEQRALITAMNIDECYKEKLHAVGICERGVIIKTRDGHGQTILVQTSTRNTFAISKKLAQDVVVTPEMEAQPQTCSCTKHS